MRNFIIIITFFTMGCVFAQQPNDCVNAITICGNQDINLNVNGRGNVQEIGANACNSQENNSLWVRFTILTGGTLGFVLTPQSASLAEDYDFWVFGPNVSCTGLGTAVRCSTTNPNNAGLNYNTTGMNGTETDTSEGPGSDGNSFVRWLDVLPNQTYYLVIDRPIGNSAFSLSWTGTAVIKNPFDKLIIPFIEFPTISLCDSGLNGTEPFNFSTLSSNFLNGNVGFTITYYTNESNANISLNPITGTTNVSQGTYWARIEHDETECFELREINVSFEGVEIEDKHIDICDEDSNGSQSVNLNDYTYNIQPADSYNLTFHTQQNDAENGINAINSTVTVVPGNNTFYIRAETTNQGCVGVGVITLSMQTPIQLQNIEKELCDDDFDGFLSVNLSDYIAEVALSNNYSQVQYFTSLADAQANTNPIINFNNYNVEDGQMIFYRFNNESCVNIATIDFIIPPIPQIENQSFNICDEDDNGFELINLSNFDYTVTPQGNFSLTFHTSQSDADNGINAISPLVNAQSGSNVYYIRVFFDSDICIGTGTITLNIQSPIDVQNQNYTYCDDDYDGLLTVDLSSFNADVLLSQNITGFAYYTTLQDAEDQTNEITDFQNYAIADGETIFIRFYNESCYVIATLQFNLLPIPVLGEDEIIQYCPEQAPIELSVNSSYVSYTWSHDATATTSTVNVSNPGTYTVTAFNDEGCSDQKTFTLQYLEFPYITYVDVQNGTATVTGFGGPPVYYSIDDGITWQTFNTFTNLPAGVYYVRIKLDEGCVSEPFIFIILDIPNTFTPNGDGINDTWNIPYLEAFGNAKVSVFDRYGKLVYNQTVESLFKWDGKYLGRPLPSTTYWYTIELPIQTNLQGWVLIKNRNNEH